MKAFEFCYNSCIHESAPATISVHFSKEGAEKAMEWHKEEERKKYEEMRQDYKTDFKFGWMESWFVREIEILP